MCEVIIPDVTTVRQGMLFWLDMTNETNKIVPNKKRLWLIVSNDETNATSATYTVVPVYSGTECTKNTHVFFKNGEHECIVKCEYIMPVSRYFVKKQDYEGTVSAELLNKVQMAITNQFMNTISINTTMTVANTNVTNTNVNNNEEDEEDIENNTNTIRNINRPATHRSGKHLSYPDEALQYYSDTYTMSIKDLNTKYPHCVRVRNKNELTARRGSIRRAFERKGIAYKHLER